jgi:hypothetical protein
LNVQLLNKLLYRITSHLPCRIISDGTRKYLERYYLFTLFGVRFYIHRFVGSDPDRGLHDHPWRWAGSLILSGWYWEETRYGTHAVRWLNGLVGDTFHRVILPDGISEVWTLFFHRADKSKKWGFMREKGQLGIVYEVYKYRGNELGKDGEWWKVAPKGAECDERMAA